MAKTGGSWGTRDVGESTSLSEEWRRRDLDEISERESREEDLPGLRVFLYLRHSISSEHREREARPRDDKGDR